MPCLWPPYYYIPVLYILCKYLSTRPVARTPPTTAKHVAPPPLKRTTALGDFTRLKYYTEYTCPDHGADASARSTRIQDLCDMLPAVPVRGLEVVQLLVQIPNVSLQFRRFRHQSALKVCRRFPREPLLCVSSPPWDSFGFHALCSMPSSLCTYILPTPS